MTRLRGMIVCAGVTLGLASGLAMAVPPVFEKASKDAMFVIAIPSAQKLDKSMQALSTAIELPIPLPGVEELLAMGGIGDGLDLTKGIAIVVMPGAANADPADMEDFESRAIVLLPVTNYATFLGGFSAKPGEAGGVDTFNLNGTDMFARSIGDGYAVLAPKKEPVAAFKGGYPTVKADMGKLGERISDTADVVLLVNMEVARPFIEQSAKAAKDRMAEQMATMGMEAEGNTDSPLAKWLSDSVVSDARTVVAGMKAGGLGASFEMAANFKEGSTMATAFKAAGNAGTLLSKLPNTQYLLAGAIDTSAAGMKSLLREMTAKAKESAPADAPQIFNGDLSEADGQSFVIGMNPTMLMGGGVLTNTVGFTSTKDPAKVISGIKTGVEALNGKSFQGMNYESTFKDKAAKVGDKSVDVWQVKMQAQEGGGMETQAMAVIFGPQGGPGGYVAAVDGGVIRTYSKNSALMAAAFKSVAGGENLASDTLIQQVGGQLPSGRLAELYIGSKNIIDMLVPMAAMLGVSVDPEAIPAQLPPVAFGLAGEGGSAHISFFIPAPVIKAGWVIGEGLAPQLGDMGGPGDMGEEPADEGATGQPRF